jgi:naphtho-gamma-pyrone polyketide synthase
LKGTLTTKGPALVAKPSTKLSVAGDAKCVKPSSNNIITRVTAIISEEIGIDPSELRAENEFAEYGIDSLLSLTISGRLREEVGLDLPTTLFAEYTTINELQSYIDGSQNPPLSPGSSSEDTDVPTPEIIPEQSMERYIEVIHATISEETGIPIEEITASARLSELGMDSLLALTTMSKLSETLEMELPQSLFADNDTLYEVERTLDMKIKQSNVTRSPDLAKFEAVAQINEVDLPPHATSVLLQGNPKTATKKLFLFPDGSGSATSYISLASVSADVAIYGLNCPWMTTPQDMKCSLKQLSAKYLSEIRRRQPHGPYYFGGWSAGGICAYEAAQQLSCSGEETARLILIDSPNPIGLENPPQRMYDFFESLGIFGMKDKAPPGWLRPHFDAFIRLLDDYEVEAFAGAPLETYIVYARDGICKQPTDPRPEIRPDDPREMLWLLNNRTNFSGSGWAELVGEGNLRIYVLDDVNHFSMMDAGPKSEELSAFIRRAVE